MDPAGSVIDEVAAMLARKRLPRRWRRITFALALLLLAVMAYLWSGRRDIAADFIADALAARDVRGSYDVTNIGFHTQRLENLVIGDPAQPDLVAKWVEVDVSLALGVPEVTHIRASGVRLRGRVADGRLILGEVDKLLPPPSGKPFSLPDVAVEIADTRLALATAAGPVAIDLAGRGNLANGFRGRARAIAERLTSGGCAIDQAGATLSVAIRDGAPRLVGPIGASSVACAGTLFSRPRVTADLRLTPALDRWRGSGIVAIPSLRSGAMRLGVLEGRVTFDGNSALTSGDIDLSSGAAAAAQASAARARAAGRYRLDLAQGDFAFRGTLGGQAIALAEPTVQPALAALADVAATPLGPIAGALADAVRRAGRRLDGEADVTIISFNGGALRIRRAEVRSASGARLALAPGSAATLYFGPGLARMDGDLALHGGGFPDVRLALSQARPGAPVTGEARLSPMSAAGARLVLTPVVFTAAGHATDFRTTALLSGPFAGGAVDGLLVPIAGRVDRRGFLVGERCTPVQFRTLQLSGLRLAAARLPICPMARPLLRSSGGRIAGGATIAAPRLAGTLGSSPITLAADRLRVDLAGFDARNLAVRLGPAGARHRLDLPSLAGRFTNSGLAGSFASASGKLAAVPLMIDDAAGTWRFANGGLALNAALRVTDAAEAPRFNPLVSRDFQLTLADNLIRAEGWLQEPATGTRITRATISHALATGRGDAVLDVPGLAFTPEFQPDRLTRLTTGVVALVDGTVTGRGDIAWGPDGVTSGGAFTTADTSLAAAFGPVDGLATTVRFTDLLGLATAPGQRATVRLIQAGIDVYEGEISYQLLTGQRVRIEAGRWPFAGGTLLLEDTILDFSRPTAKHLTFRVAGLDAAAFVAQLEFDNISATGTFDGVVPMIFEQIGGRIENGRLVARAEGGVVSYVGELTDKQLGAYGKLAFDALKSLRYDKLTIDLNGSLDGEFVAGIELDGIARDPVMTSIPGGGISGIFAQRAFGQLAKIPFEFNITARGPFRTLMATARSLEDPSLLIQSVLPDDLRGNPALTSSVQPEESEPVQ